jgi:hypothetical protein
MSLQPLFGSSDQPVQQATSQGVTARHAQATPAVSPPEPIEKSTTVRVIRRVGGSLTPSIKDALAGKVAEKTIVEEITQAAFSEYEEYDDPFTSEQLSAKWKEFLELISDRPNLISTLSNLPDLSDGNKLLLKIGNSVQEEEVRLIKQELINFLRKELRNSGIELTTSIEKIESERTHLNDQEKMQILIQKNPELIELTKKFNLGFNG